MIIHVLPKTTLGRWTIRLIIGFFLLFELFWLMVVSGQRGGVGFFSNLFLAIPILLAAMCAIAAFFVGMLGVIKNRERSVLVLLAIIIGLFVLFFVLGEIISPH